MTELPKASGIYQITTPLGRYIGQARDMRSRQQEHLRDLTSGKHCNDGLRQAWQEGGKDAIAFSVVERCSVGRLDRIEAAWIKRRGDLNEIRPAAAWWIVNESLGNAIAVLLVAIVAVVAIDWAKNQDQVQQGIGNLPHPHAPLSPAAGNRDRFLA